MTLIFLLHIFSVNIISSVGAHGDMSKLHWESEVPVIHVLNGTRATFPWIHSSNTYYSISWYYIGTRESPQRDILHIYTESMNNAYDPKQDRLSFQKRSAIMTLDDVTEDDEGDYQARVYRSVNGFSNQVEHIESITTLTVINVEDLSYTLSINGTKNSTHNFSVKPNETLILLPPWGSTITVPDRFNMTVNVTQAGAPQPTIRIWKVVNSKNHSQPICDSFHCNRYMTLTSDDAREAQECFVVIEIDFKIQNLKPVTHSMPFNISMNTTQEATRPRTILLGILAATVLLILALIAGLMFYKLVWTKCKRKPAESSQETGHLTTLRD